MADEHTISAKKTAEKPTEFATQLLEIDKGRVHDDGTARLAELIDAVCHTAGSGTLTLTIKVEPLDPESFDETGQLMVTGNVDVKIPRPKRSPSIFFANGKGRMTRTDPTRLDPRD